MKIELRFIPESNQEQKTLEQEYDDNKHSWLIIGILKYIQNEWSDEVYRKESFLSASWEFIHDNNKLLIKL